MREIQLPFRDRPYDRLQRIEHQKVWNTILPYLLFPEDAKSRKAACIFLSAKLTKMLKGRVERRKRAGKPHKRSLHLLELEEAARAGQTWEDLLDEPTNLTALTTTERSSRQARYSVYYLLRLIMLIDQYRPPVRGGSSLKKAVAIADAVGTESAKEGKREARLGLPQVAGPTHGTQTASQATPATPVPPHDDDHLRFGKRGVLHLLYRRSSLEECWSSYRSVAHLQAALVYCRHDLRYGHCELLDNPDRFLETALAFQGFILRFRVSQTNKPLIDPGKLWRIPLLKGIGTVELELKPLTAFETDTLKNYHVAKRP